MKINIDFSCVTYEALIYISLFALGAIAPWANNLGSFYSLMDIIYDYCNE